MKRAALGIICGGLLTLSASDARAYTCTRITPVTTLTPPSITVPRDLPVDSPIGSEVSSGPVAMYRCSNTPGPSLTSQNMGARADGAYVTSINGVRVYSTNIAGIGYAVGATTISGCDGATDWVSGEDNGGLGDNYLFLCWVNGLFDSQPITEQANIQYYKTAPTTGTGMVTPQNVGALILQNDNSSWETPVSRIYAAAFSVSAPACTVNRTAISVRMGTIDSRKFNGPGTWPGDVNTRSFHIVLDCNAGAYVSLQMDGIAQNASQGVLNLSGGADSASGLGIQLLYNNAPLPLSRVINTGTAASAGMYDIPLQARYYQTGSEVTPGTADASATFTLSYQ